MARKWRLQWHLFAAFSVVLVMLSACGRNYFTAEREPWRREAEVACLKSGVVKESPARVRVSSIEGPGMCGADFPLKIAALGESRMLSYGDDLRPPGSVPGGGPRWPISDPRAAPNNSADYSPAPPTRYDGSPLTITPPAHRPATTPAGGYDTSYAPTGGYVQPAGPGRYGRPPATLPPGAKRPSVFDAPSGPAGRAPQNDDDDEDELAAPGPMERARPGYPPQRSAYPPAQPVPLGKRPLTTASVGPVEIKPQATLACPIVSALDKWIMDAVQPSSLRWFGQPVVEIKQISAYSCRGMNGQRGARISEHAFGNALDIAAFILADGRTVTVKNGWKGTPEEQAFLHDVQGAACEQFSTVLAPGSNVYHYDHIHVDLMRRASGRVICQPGAIPGEVVAARARGKDNMFARRGDRLITGSIGKAKADVKKSSKKKGSWPPLEEDESVMEELDSDEPRGGPGED
jgi:hypothetical protein